jgi:hypothetical protein
LLPPLPRALQAYIIIIYTRKCVIIFSRLSCLSTHVVYAQEQDTVRELLIRRFFDVHRHCRCRTHLRARTHTVITFMTENPMRDSIHLEHLHFNNSFTTVHILITIAIHICAVWLALLYTHTHTHTHICILIARWFIPLRLQYCEVRGKYC